LFGIRFFTPQALSGDQSPIAGGVLCAGDSLLRVPVDLAYWTVADYKRQWADGIQRLARGASSSALVYGYRGPEDAAHLMWALWRDDQRVYVQDLAVVSSELDAPFDPSNPYEHVGERISPEQGLPVCEWQLEVKHVLEAAFGARRKR